MVKYCPLHRAPKLDIALCDIQNTLFAEDVNSVIYTQAAVVSILLHGRTKWMLIKHMDKKLDGNYTRILQAILNKSWRQHPTKQQLYSHQPPIMKIIKVWQTRHTGHCWRSKDELISDILLWNPSHGRARQDDKLEPIYNCSVPIEDVALKT